MIPSIFISSTVEDLTHLREAIRDSIAEIGYNPVLSDYGDVGYLPTSSAEESCYRTVRECQLAVLIIGKRYGSLGTNSLSITHNEFQTAKTNGTPIISLVDQEVLSYKKVFDAAAQSTPPTVFPGMDAPPRTFSFVQEVMDAPTNNGLLPFRKVSDARLLLKKQLAHIFGNLLQNRFDPVRAGIQDVLSEVMTLRHEMKNRDTANPQQFLRATRYLLDDKNKEYREFIEQICGSIENAVPILLKCRTFEEFITATETRLSIVEKMPDMNEALASKRMMSYHNFLLHYPSAEEPQPPTASWLVMTGKEAVINPTANEVFQVKHEFLRKISGT